jgi:DNA-binding NtrC family response regulator
VTPLRERLADLEALCERFMEQIALRTGTPQREITAGAIAALAAYDWPGNVRELSNVLERATMLTDSPRLTGDDFATVLPPRSSTMVGSPHAIRSYADALADFDRATFRSALSAAGGNVQKAARLLGLSRATLYKRLARLGIASQDRDAGLTA